MTSNKLNTSHAQLTHLVHLTLKMTNSPSPLLCFILIQIQENNTIWRRQPHIRTHTPYQLQFSPAHRTPILLLLCRSKCHPAVGISIADYIRPRGESRRQGWGRFPAVGTEEEVDCSIVDCAGGAVSGEIVVDQCTDYKVESNGC
jgi:hypothetical protein